MNVIKFTAILVLLVCYVSSKDDVSDAMLKLGDYGYLNKAPDGTGFLLDPAAVNNAIKNFQAYARLKTTGVLDKATVDKLKEPRCGMADPKFSKREKRYVHQGSKWTKRRLTYKIVKYSAHVSRLRPGAVRRAIFKALSKWMQVTNLDFIETASNDADIIIRFVRGRHNDPYAFDGRGGTLAHAFYPMNNRGLAGDAHFDDDEYFTLRSEKGTNFYWVALHEFGHSIGMEHSDQLGAVMYPWYQGYKGDDVELTQDDITGIQQLYGKRKTKPKTSVQPKTPKLTVPPTPKKGPECIGRIKAVLLGRDERTYVINDDKVYVLGRHLKVEQGPIMIERFFPGLKKVDVAIKAENGDVIFFHKDKYWIYDSRKLRTGPNHISKYGLLADMNDLDGGFSWRATNKQYFFKGDRFWRYDALKKRIDPGYPKSMKAWDGIPSNIDAVFQWRNKAVYFFKGQQFHRFDTRRITTVPGYPKKIQGDFVICPEHNKPAQLSAKLTVDQQLSNSPNQGSRGTSEKIPFEMILFVIFSTILKTF